MFTLPAEVAAIAFQNKALVYDLLFKAASETMLTIAGDPKHLGAHIGITAVLHTWGSAMTHHPHVHMIVPSGGLSCHMWNDPLCKGFFRHLITREWCGHMFGLSARLWAAGLDEVRDTSG